MLQKINKTKQTKLNKRKSFFSCLSVFSVFLFVCLFDDDNYDD